MLVADENQWVQITSKVLSVGEVDAFLREANCGGISIFIGTTRQFTRGKETALLSYECYEPMALTVMRNLLIEAQKQWEIRKGCMVHRIGDVPIAEASVIIGVATPHRKDAFEASRFLIDALKEQVPIWKKETFSDGTKEWVQGTLPPNNRSYEEE